MIVEAWFTRFIYCRREKPNLLFLEGKLPWNLIFYPTYPNQT